MSNPTLKALVTVSLEAVNPYLPDALPEVWLEDVQEAMGREANRLLMQAEETSSCVADFINDATGFYLNSTSYYFDWAGTEIENGVLKVSVLMSCECDFDLERNGEISDISVANMEAAQTGWEKHLRGVLMISSSEEEFELGCSDATAQGSLKEACQEASGMLVSSAEVLVSNPTPPTPTPQVP